VGELVAFNLDVALLTALVLIFGMLAAQISRAAVGAGRVFELLDTPDDVADQPEASPCRRLPGACASLT
jgi:ABC-type multidrug transport system fused ATPase/permease subunit